MSVMGPLRRLPHKHSCVCGIALKVDGTPYTDNETEPKCISGEGPDGDSTGPGRGDCSEPLLSYLNLIHADWVAGRLD